MKIHFSKRLSILQAPKAIYFSTSDSFYKNLIDSMSNGKWIKIMYLLYCIERQSLHSPAMATAKVNIFQLLFAGVWATGNATAFDVKTFPAPLKPTFYPSKGKNRKI